MNGVQTSRVLDNINLNDFFLLLLSRLNEISVLDCDKE